MWWNELPDRPLTDVSRRRLLTVYDRIDRAHAGPSGRLEVLEEIVGEVLRRDPDDGDFWFDSALHAKWRRDWRTARAHGIRGLDLLPADGREGQPVAWNLGIAATALGDWGTARRAWAAFGVDVGGADDEPVLADFGPCPVRLNASPRSVGEPEVEIDGRVWDREVVWGDRIDPSRVQISNVPLPTSGHRCGDIVLHDGDPEGTRTLGEDQVPVFNEIALWARSPLPTCSVDAAGPGIQQLLTDLENSGFPAEDWTTSVRMLCAACSNGSPGAHDHPFGAATGGARTLGVSGRPEDIEQVLRSWAAARHDRSHGTVTVELA